MKKLYKSDVDRKPCGVCGGIAEYLGIDSTIVRLIWVVLVVFFGTGILAYIIAALVIPDYPNKII
ncbi:MAG: PspC domain-containing protein [Hominilimicola sp.]|uniref:PspC domain-containing protein n=1 Tax=Hominilimicola sp. TaxID=3073571 RepID=UPI00399BE8ED